uniref:Uncharacterized protein n=1 Tax=viral metagenome TaxID=1070528 RepID=A0A6C0B9U5_9ZZZZ
MGNAPLQTIQQSKKHIVVIINILILSMLLQYYLPIK